MCVHVHVHVNVCVCFIFRFPQVPFTAALDLVQSRQVVLKNASVNTHTHTHIHTHTHTQGHVYVPKTKDDMILSLVCNKFRSRISEELVVSHMT